MEKRSTFSSSFGSSGVGDAFRFHAMLEVAAVDLHFLQAPPPPRGELAASPRDWHFTLRVHVPQLELELLLAEVPAAGLSKLQAASYRKLLLCLCATKRS